MTYLMIILTSTEADQVRGITTPGHALEPFLLADGVTYVLPVAVLADPAHAMHHAFLNSLPQRDVDDSEFPQPEDPFE